MMENKNLELNALCDEVLEDVSGGALNYTWKCPRCGMIIKKNTEADIKRELEQHKNWHKLFG